MVNMNKHDIEELQAFLQSEYIEESTSRSLREVKQHQQTLKTSEDKQEFRELQKYARNFLKNDFGDLVFQPRVRNKDDNQKYNYIVNLIKKIKNNSSDRKSKDELFKILGIGQNKVEIRNITLNGTVHVSLYVIKGYQKLGLKPNMFFVHTTNATLNPPNTLIPKEANAARGQYCSKQCYFYCIIANNINEAVQKKLANQPLYGYHFYQYIPNKSDEIFLDSFHMNKSEMINRNKDVFPVFIITNKPLHVKDITNLVITKKSSEDLKDKLYEYEELVDELHELEDKYSPLLRKHVPKSKNVIENEKEIEKVQNKIKEFEKKYGFTRAMVESYIDETIERFDAFMEEFNLTQMEDKYNE